MRPGQWVKPGVSPAKAPDFPIFHLNGESAGFTDFSPGWPITPGKEKNLRYFYARPTASS